MGLTNLVHARCGGPRQARSTCLPFREICVYPTITTLPPAIVSLCTISNSSSFSCSRQHVRYRISSEHDRACQYCRDQVGTHCTTFPSCEYPAATATDQKVKVLGQTRHSVEFTNKFFPLCDTLTEVPEDSHDSIMLLELQWSRLALAQRRARGYSIKQEDPSMLAAPQKISKRR